MPQIIWTEEEDQIIRENFGKIPYYLIALKIKNYHLPFGMIESRCRDLGLMPRKNRYVILAKKILKPIVYGAWSLALIYILALVAFEHSIWLACILFLLPWLSPLVND